MRLLIVTSDPVERAQLERLLGPAADDATRTVLSFADTLAELRLPPRLPLPDLVLLNQHVEGTGPAEVWRALSVHYRHLPVVILADQERLAEARRALRRGALAFIKVAVIGRELLLPLLRMAVTAMRQRRAVNRAAPGREVIDAMADGLLTTDARGRIEYANPAAVRLLGGSLATLRGRAINELMALRDSGTHAALEHPVLRVLATGGIVRLPTASILEQGQRADMTISDATAPIRDNSGAVSGVVMTFYDSSETRQLQAQVDHLAWHDYLTGLPNRFAAELHLEQILVEARQRQVPLAVMYLDLDKFKAVNDVHGHAAGDALLVAVTARLRGCFRSIDLISRQGGDEFLILMAPGTNRNEVAQAAARILAALARPCKVEDNLLSIGCSIGIALYPQHGERGELLLQHADAALRSAKSSGRNTWKFFSRRLMERVVEGRQIDDGLRRALDERQLMLHYQPKFRLRDGALCGCEALLRWHHAEWGWVEPERIIRSAEASGLIVPLGRWVQQQAVAQAVQWERAGYAHCAIAINVSALEVMQADFAAFLQQQVAAAGLAPQRLQLELTESALMQDLPGAAETLRRLSMSGLSLAIDDFGTGYSSLSYLAELPIDLLKLDRSFVHHIDDAAPRRQTLLHAVLTLAENLGVLTVAEGVETAAEAAFLQDAGCAQGQGFHYSRALDADSFTQRYLATPA
ncbi:EAL domain-containing protein [Duganella sp. FT80W]|uniref:EAL domain-containing protein n=1 Tax=Duganella guangzhouensis TaxID=2666084 RepID=A0A6I2L545_9BURK|nr:EAL domain-containing protein [Duganella guangzhouensis]MRW93301.1 EAL domain-containing protein [Duganella guangzhouensis]